MTRLLRVYFDHHNFAMIFEYHPWSLLDFVRARRTTSVTYLEECRHMMQGILRGLDCLHRSGVAGRN